LPLVHHNSTFVDRRKQYTIGDAQYSRYEGNALAYAGFLPVVRYDFDLPLPRCIRGEPLLEQVGYGVGSHLEFRLERGTAHIA